MDNKSIAVRVLGLAIFLVPASAVSNESDATARQLMVRSGLSVQLGAFADQVGSEIRQNSANIDPAVAAALLDAAKQAFQAERLREDITIRVGKKLTVADMKGALAWLETDAGKRVTRAEELASTADSQRIVAFAEGLKGKPLAPKRQHAGAELIAATAGVSNARTVAETMALAVALGMDALQPRERRVGESALRMHIRQSMAGEKVQAFFEQQLSLSVAYAYREVSDGDLAAYIRFLKSPVGKRYQEGATAAFVEGLQRAARQMGELAGQRQPQARL